MRVGISPGKRFHWTAPWFALTSTPPERSIGSRRQTQRARTKKGDSLLGCRIAGESLGRSRGGLTSKLHIAFEGKGRPVAIHLTGGERHDCTQLEPLLDGIRVPRRRGRPRKRPGRAVADKGYSYPRCRKALRRRGIARIIPERRDQREQRKKRGSRGGRPWQFDKAVYRLRSWAERGVNRLKQWRRVATRYEKRAVNYLAMVQIAAIVIWIGH
jgi:transposase